MNHKQEQISAKYVITYCQGLFKVYLVEGNDQDSHSPPGLQGLIFTKLTKLFQNIQWQFQNIQHQS